MRDVSVPAAHSHRVRCDLTESIAFFVINLNPCQSTPLPPMLQGDTPPLPSANAASSGGLGPGAAAGVSIAVLLVVGIAAVPTFFYGRAMLARCFGRGASSNTLAPSSSSSYSTLGTAPKTDTPATTLYGGGYSDANI